MGREGQKRKREEPRTKRISRHPLYIVWKPSPPREGQRSSGPVARGLARAPKTRFPRFLRLFLVFLVPFCLIFVRPLFSFSLIFVRHLFFLLSYFRASFFLFVLFSFNISFSFCLIFVRLFFLFLNSSQLFVLFGVFFWLLD